MEIIGNKVRMQPQEVAQYFFMQGIQKEEIVLKVLQYTIDRNGILKNRKGKTVGSLNRQGYEKIQITLGGKCKDVFTHRIQAFKKFGRKMYEKEIQVRHLNDIKTDNSYQNIELGTAKDNYQDRGKEAIVKSQKIATKASIKYSDELIQNAKNYYKKTNNLKKTAQKFNIPETSLHYRLKGKKKQIR